MGNKELSEAQKRAIKKWDSANLKRFSMAVPVSVYENMRRHIERINDYLDKNPRSDQKKETQNHFINEAIKEKIANDEAIMEEEHKHIEL